MPTTTRRSRRKTATPRVGPAMTTRAGRLRVLAPEDVAAIIDTALALLEDLGLSDAPPEVVALVTTAGGQVGRDGRLVMPRSLVDRAIRAQRGAVRLCARDPAFDMHLSPQASFVGTGGAAPLIWDGPNRAYRPSTLGDLYDVARLVDHLPHIQFFARTLVARDIADPKALDINTCYAALAGTRKHVMVSVSDPAHVDDIRRICDAVAGGADAFDARPFLSLNINHVTPPMRFDPDAARVLVAAARAGLPCMINTFGQLGASSPVTQAGCLAQTTAETLAGLVVAWLAGPGTPAIFGPRPMVTDLRTGGMAGGSGEQALLTAGAVQIAQHLGLANSTIAGATDSAWPDAQAGFEKALAVSMAVNAGANLVTQAAGTQAGLMGNTLAGYVIDNDMLGAVLRSAAPVEVGTETLDAGQIAQTIRSSGHFLGEPQTLARMSRDFLYPDLANRLGIDAWHAAGQPDLVSIAATRADDLLALPHFPAIPADVDTWLRATFDIALPSKRMTAS